MNINKIKQRVIVVGNSFSTRLGVIRAVGHIGCEVIIIHIGNFNNTRPKKPIDCYSKYVSQVLFFDRQEGEKGLVRLLLEQCIVDGQKAIIIPTSDFSAVAIDNEEIRKHFLVPYINNTISSIEYWMNKANQKTIAIQEGLKVAGSTIIEKKDDAFIIPDTVKYPCFTKPLASIGAGKRCMGRCDNKFELQNLLNLAGKNSINKILVEDFLNIDEEYAVLGISDGNNVVIPGVIKFVRESKNNKGVAMVGKVLPVDGFKDVIGKFVSFIRNIGLVGLFDIDFFKCQGALYFGELNVRIGASGGAIAAMGANLPVMFVKAMLGEEIGDVRCLINTSAIFVNERMCIEDWLSGRMSTLSLYKIINSADIQLIKCKKDIKPYNEISKEIRRNLFNYKRIVKNILYIIR